MNILSFLQLRSAPSDQSCPVRRPYEMTVHERAFTIYALLPHEAQTQPTTALRQSGCSLQLHPPLLLPIFSPPLGCSNIQPSSNPVFAMSASRNQSFVRVDSGSGTCSASLENSKLIECRQRSSTFDKITPDQRAISSLRECTSLRTLGFDLPLHAINTYLPFNSFQSS